MIGLTSTIRRTLLVVPITGAYALPLVAKITPDTVLPRRELTQCVLSFGGCRPTSVREFSQWEAAARLTYGFGRDDNEVAAARWYEMEALNGNARAAHNFGLMLLYGQGILTDREAGLHWLRVARASNSLESMFALANDMRVQDQSPDALVRAFALYKQAAMCGHIKSQHALANMFALGLGTTANLLHAHAWWQLASAKGHLLARAAATRAKLFLGQHQVEMSNRILRSVACRVSD
ncbi:MAG: tetratricopeptide repeat protein [Hyphomicrobiaceae bacterium]